MKLDHTGIRFSLLILLFGVVCFIPFAGTVNLFDWDELIFAESAREMIMSGDYLTVSIRYEPFWEKPPLFIWLQALSMKVFGINEFAARFPNALSGIITLLVLYHTGRRIYDHRFGMLWTLAYAGSILPFFYFRTGIIDPWFNLFIFLGIIFMVRYLVPEKFPGQHLNIGISAAFLGLAVLTKGPVAVLVLGLCFLVYLVYRRGKVPVKISHILIFVVVLILVGGSWFGAAILKGNFQVIKDFIVYQAGLFSEDFAGHSGFPGFHFIILLFGVFPASVLMLPGFTRKKEDHLLARVFRYWMYTLLVLILVLFSLVQTKLIHYSSLTYFPVTYLAARVTWLWYDRKIEIRGWNLLLAGFVGFVLLFLMIAIPVIGMNPSLIRDAGAGFMTPYVEGVLQTNAGWGKADLLPGALLAVGMIISIAWTALRDVRGPLVMYFTVLIVTVSSIMLFVPKIEKMIQGPAIEFMRSHSGENEQVITAGFKSYAHYFYAEWQPDEDAPEKLEEWITNPKLLIEKTLYVVMKADNSKKILERFPQIEVLERKGGFVFGVIR